MEKVCIGQLPKSPKRCKNQDMSQCKWCCSEAFETKLVKFPERLFPQEIFKKWITLNNNWNMGLRLRLEQDLKCDQLVLFPYIYLRKFPTASLPSHHEPTDCIQEKIHVRYNCTQKSCKKFLTYLVAYTRMKNKEIVASYSFPNAGTRLFGKNYVVFKKLSRKHVIDKGALLDPIPPFWWGIILFLSFLVFAFLHYLKIKAALLLVVQVALEQGYNFKSEITLRKCSIIMIWSFGCILSRNVYTSSMYSFITATNIPTGPSTLKEIVNDSTIDIIQTNNELEFYTNLMHNYISNNSMISNYLRDRNSSKLAKCTLYDESATQIFRYVSFFRNLTSFSEIWCGIQLPEKNITVQTESSLTQFALVYHSTSVYKAVFSVLGKRFRFNSNENDFEVKMYVYHSHFRHGFHYYYHEALARFEATGIIGKIQDAYQTNKVVKELRKYSTELKIDMKTLLNRFHDGESTSSLVYDFGKDGSQTDVEATKIEALMVVWILYATLTFACVTLLIFEHLVRKYVGIANEVKFTKTFIFVKTVSKTFE
ncbi:unnamed protein product [Orchesella dallaii]|uniref:Ionotropic glutamate receptor C-terminal domain-containing protein n=1 Tax=Orchesella dallaii TaxID=48710 RepID=A0ABP1QDZ0_9HEXA